MRIRHVAVTENRVREFDRNRVDDGSIMLYHAPLFKDSVAKLNEEFISLKKLGEQVTRTSISEFIQIVKD